VRRRLVKMSTCRRSLSDSKYDKKILDNSTGSVELSTSRGITIKGVIIRRLFKTTSIDFDVPLAATITVEDDQGIKLGTLEIDEHPQPSKEFYEGLKMATRIFFGLGVIPYTDSMSLRLLEGLLPKLTNGECTETELGLFKSAFEDSSSLVNPPPSARCDELLTVPMSVGHFGEYAFESGIPIDPNRTYVLIVTVHRRAWYKFLNKDTEIIKCGSVDIKFGPKEDSHIVNAILSGFTFGEL
jgi:hypothetical protein